MRLFAALPLPDVARAPLAEAAGSLRAQGWAVRWVDPSLLHLTLKFYGEVTADAAERLAEALASAARDSGAVTLAVTGLDTFPAGRAPRVIVAALAADPGLELLQHRVETASGAAGFPPEGRPFRPHLTLGRVRRGERLPGGARRHITATAVKAAALVDTMELVESLRGTGPRYRALHRYPLVA